MQYPTDSELIVIGGGMMGASCAYRLSQAGVDVTLLEMENIASGASGRNSGQLVQLDGRDWDPKSIATKVAYAKANLRLLCELNEELEINFELNKCGGMDLALEREEAKDLQTLVEIHHKAGDEEVEWLDRKETLKHNPLLTSKVYGSIWRSTDGTLDSVRLTHSMVDGAKRRKTRVFTNSKVDEILVKDGEAKGVRIGSNTIKAKFVVNATNAWARTLTDIDILPLRATAVLTEEIPNFPVPNIIAAMNGTLVYLGTQQAKGNIIVDGFGEPRCMQDHYKLDVKINEIRAATSIIANILPSLGNFNIIRSWSGALAHTADGMPCVGPLPDVRNLVIAAGFNNGMTNVAIVGKLVTDYILRRRTDLPLAPLDPTRYYRKNMPWPDSYTETTIEEFCGKSISPRDG